ncbi:MCE family protein [candidate division KSB1 bacterium]|nr:MCE family protein [candidate division KSB1 bacterium]
MEYKSSELKAGIFIIISVLIFIAFLVVIIGANRWEEKDTYRTRFDFVGGVEKGSLIRYSGMEVGRVVDLYLPEDNSAGVEILMEITKGTPIHSDSRAFITTIGLLGAFYIEITSGSLDAPLLKPGDLISSRNVTAFAQMSDSATEITDELSELLNRFNDLLNEENRENINVMISSLSEISATSTKNMDTVVNNLNEITKNLNKTVQGINNLLAVNDSSITNSVQGLESLVTESNKIVSNLNNMIENMDYHMTQNGDSYSEMMGHLNSLIRNLEIFSQSIKEQPWNLVRKSPLPERELP